MTMYEGFNKKRKEEENWRKFKKYIAYSVIGGALLGVSMYACEKTTGQNWLKAEQALEKAMDMPRSGKNTLEDNYKKVYKEMFCKEEQKIQDNQKYNPKDGYNKFIPVEE